jgi:hypothetical protein
MFRLLRALLLYAEARGTWGECWSASDRRRKEAS